MDARLFDSWSKLRQAILSEEEVTGDHKSNVSYSALETYKQQEDAVFPQRTIPPRL